MSIMKKLLAVALTASISAGAAIAGTVAYLQDTDSDVNVMTLGNVKIEQHEYQRATNDDGTFKTDTIDGKPSYVLEDFKQLKPLMPATEVDAYGQPYNYGAGTWDTTTVRMSQVKSYGGMQVFENPNAQDKFVTVENTGKSDAYVRTLVAIEVGDADADLIGTSYHGTWTKNEIGPVAIDGNKYMVYEYVYAGGKLDNGTWRHENGVLPAGDTTYPNLSQVYLNAKATNEDMEKIDGNGNGLYDILVLSQAVQTAGFENAQTALDTAFGKTADKAAAWFGEVVPAPVADSDEALKNAILDPNVKTVIVDGALTYDWGGDSYENSKALPMAGKTFVGADEDASITFKGYGSANPIKDVTLKNIIVKDQTVGDNETSWEHGYLEFEGLTAENVVFADSIMLDGKSTLTNCSMNNTIASWYGVWVEGGSAVIDGCTFTGTRAVKIHEAYGAEVESVVVKNSKFELTEKPGVVIGDLDADTSVTITGSTFKTQAGDQGKFIYESDTDVTTFNFSESGNTVK